MENNFIRYSVNFIASFTGWVINAGIWAFHPDQVQACFDLALPVSVLRSATRRDEAT